MGRRGKRKRALVSDIVIHGSNFSLIDNDLVWLSRRARKMRVARGRKYTQAQLGRFSDDLSPSEPSTSTPFSSSTPLESLDRIPSNRLRPSLHPACPSVAQVGALLPPALKAQL